MRRSYRVLTGPTASGKTDMLLQRAATVPVRVISADSRQVYRGMDIGTGKPTPAELVAAPHYGLDLLDPGQSFSAHDFVVLAAAALTELDDFEGEVWVCGGTGLYIRALIEQLPLGSPPRPALRDALCERFKAESPRAVAAALKLELRDADNPVRVLRAAETLAHRDPQHVYAYAGLPADADPGVNAAEDRRHREALEVLAGWDCAGIEVLDPGANLDERILLRVTGMFDAGLTDEVERLRARGSGATRHVAQGIAYAEAGALLDGELTEAAAIARAVIRTRQYAKRQRTYFRGHGWTGPAAYRSNC